MKPIDQTLFGEEGNCREACIASLLHLSIEEVPRVGFDPDNSRLNAWLVHRGLYAVTLSGEQTCDGQKWYPRGYHVLGGMGINGPHAVVAHGAAIVHDPNPNRAGLRTHEEVMILVPIDPGVA